jgi:hypothetical protein
MAIEEYKRKPRGQKATITKYRVRIRTTVESTYEEGVRIPVNIDELHDDYYEAKRAEERHWLSIRDGTMSAELEKELRRLSEPTMGSLLQHYADKEVPLRAKDSQDIERKRLEKTIPAVRLKLGRNAKDRTRAGTILEDNSATFGEVLVCACNKQVIKLWIEQGSYPRPWTSFRTSGLNARKSTIPAKSFGSQIARSCPCTERECYRQKSRIRSCFWLIRSATLTWP